MRRAYGTTTGKITYAVVLVFLLLSSFGLHAIQVPHEHSSRTAANHHQNAGGQPAYWSLGEYMHVADKKIFILPASLQSIFAAIVEAVYGTWLTLLRFVALAVGLLLIRQKVQKLMNSDHILYCYSQGLLNPKIYN